jgi:Sulfotransferase family
MNAIPSAAELLHAARERTGLEELGDPHFALALERLLQSIGTEAAVTPDGATAATDRFLRLIVNRLRFEADAARSPEILTEPLLPPLIVCGLPRVGSTKLHRLLAESGDFQSLLFWQGFNPAPVPGAPADQPDPRIAQAASFLEWRSRSNPRTDAAHHMAALEPEEDTYLLEYTLHTYWPYTYFNVPSFLSWLAGQERGPAFAYVRGLLQYLQYQFHRSGHPRPWLLKSPPNLGFERELAHQLPGAKFVVLHRDPVQVLPSLVGIVRETRRLYCSGPGDLRIVADWALAEYAGAMQRHMQWRKSAPPKSLLDLSYDDVRDNEADAVTRIYEHCGLALSAEARARMDRWSAENAQHSHGEHLYSLDESDLSRRRIENAFSRYLAAYGSYL